MTKFLSAFGALMLVLLARDAFGCSCAPPPAPKEALEKAAAVFSGKVIEIKQEQEFSPKRVTIEIAKTWKGTDGKQVTVTTAGDGAMCGVSFEKGKSYLVYCYGEKDKLGTNLCTRTKALDVAKDDLNDLGDGKEP